MEPVKTAMTTLSTSPPVFFFSAIIFALNQTAKCTTKKVFSFSLLKKITNSQELDLHFGQVTYCSDRANGLLNYTIAALAQAVWPREAIRDTTRAISAPARTSGGMEDKRTRVRSHN